MADNNQAEQKPQAPEGKKEEKKQTSGLENLVSEGKTAVNALLTTGALGLSAFFQGIGDPIVNIPYTNIPINAGTLSVTASQPLSTIITKEKIKSKDLRNDAIYGLLQLPLFQYIADTSQNLGKVYGYGLENTALIAGGATLAAMPLLVAVLYPIRYFMNRGTFKGFGETFSKDYLKTTAMEA